MDSIGPIGGEGRGAGKPGDGFVESDRVKTVLVLVTFLVLIFGAIVVFSYV
ncbi:hypothetical protein HUG10_00945 [Halorarum halophilum]|uniref:Uncharacterized protein n=1 Tax=Halorarum halophilum TaxID=2743090 RepID=A0A7D5GFQ0_9EURY|nr:hypothetical protein [Halobaculum halophilum]QLG26191.1 hypothetical protein HUG10_00945 [Halobaculum halophilum]